MSADEIRGAVLGDQPAQRPMRLDPDDPAYALLALAIREYEQARIAFDAAGVALDAVLQRLDVQGYRSTHTSAPQDDPDAGEGCRHPQPEHRRVKTFDGDVTMCMACGDEIDDG